MQTTKIQGDREEGGESRSLKWNQKGLAQLGQTLRPPAHYFAKPVENASRDPADCGADWREAAVGVVTQKTRPTGRHWHKR